MKVRGASAVIVVGSGATPTVREEDAHKEDAAFLINFKENGNALDAFTHCDAQRGRKNPKSLLCHHGHKPAFPLCEAELSKPPNVFYSAASPLCRSSKTAHKHKL